MVVESIILLIFHKDFSMLNFFPKLFVHFFFATLFTFFLPCPLLLGRAIVVKDIKIVKTNEKIEVFHKGKKLNNLSRTSRRILHKVSQKNPNGYSPRVIFNSYKDLFAGSSSEAGVKRNISILNNSLRKATGLDVNFVGQIHGNKTNYFFLYGIEGDTDNNQPFEKIEFMQGNLQVWLKNPDGELINTKIAKNNYKLAKSILELVQKDGFARLSTFDLIQFKENRAKSAQNLTSAFTDATRALNKIKSSLNKIRPGYIETQKLGDFQWIFIPEEAENGSLYNKNIVLPGNIKFYINRFVLANEDGETVSLPLAKNPQFIRFILTHEGDYYFHEISNQIASFGKARRRNAESPGPPQIMPTKMESEIKVAIRKIKGIFVDKFMEFKEVGETEKQELEKKLEKVKFLSESSQIGYKFNYRHCPFELKTGGFFYKSEALTNRSPAYLPLHYAMDYIIRFHDEPIVLDHLTKKVNERLSLASDLSIQKGELVQRIKGLIEKFTASDKARFEFKGEDGEIMFIGSKVKI